VGIRGRTITGFDIVGFSVAGLCLLASLVATIFAVPVFESMLKDLDGSLPALTKLFLLPWITPALALLAPIAISIGIAMNRSRQIRAVLMIATIVYSLALPAAFLIAMYLPVFNLAANLE